MWKAQTFRENNFWSECLKCLKIGFNNIRGISVMSDFKCSNEEDRKSRIRLLIFHIKDVCFDFRFVFSFPVLQFSRTLFWGEPVSYLEKVPRISSYWFKHMQEYGRPNVRVCIYNWIKILFHLIILLFQLINYFELIYFIRRYYGCIVIQNCLLMTL